MPASRKEMTTAGPAYLAAATPVVAKMPPPTTLAMPSAMRLAGPRTLEFSRSRSVSACEMIASRFVCATRGIVAASAAAAHC